jgi:hypothetical protein
MPANYILKLEMDRQHEAIIVIKRSIGKKPTIIGGSVFRPFKS